MLYRTMQPEYKSAEYLSVVKCASNRRLISRFETGCHGLRVDTGRWADGVHLDRTDRLCLVCKSLDCVEEEQHFVFDCQRTAISDHSIWTSSSTVVLLQTLCLCVNQMHVVASLGNALHVGSKLCVYEFAELNNLTVGSQLPPRTLSILID